MRSPLWPAALLPLLAVAAGQERAAEIADILGQRQLDPLPRQEMLAADAGDLESLLRTRDPYARLLSPEEYAAFRAGDAAGVGIGIQLGGADGRWCSSMRWGSRPGHTTFPPSSRVASDSASRWPGPWSTSPGSSSPTSLPGASTRSRGAASSIS